jgi:hypothetical protein
MGPSLHDKRTAVARATVVLGAHALAEALAEANRLH